MHDDYSDLYEESVESLATSGYCDLAAVVLREFHPGAQTYRITNDRGERFAHVFVVIDDTALDITGACSLTEMLDRHSDVEGAQSEPTTPEAVATFFVGHGRTSTERRIVMQRFREHICASPDRFLLNAS